MEDIIIKLLKLFLPRLKELAAQTGSPIDDMIIGILETLLEGK